MVVNDGSTDDTLQVLEPFLDRILLVSYERNAGKGTALRRGFERAKKEGFRYALTLDADGQHFPEEIPLLTAALREDPEALIVGERQERGQTRGSRFANRFSNFWFAVQTAQYLKDTQTGMRIYPLWQLPQLALLTSRYEAELELLVWSAWRGVRIKSVPVRVYYPPREERVSHFRPMQDFARISVFNTLMLVAAVVYGYPSMLLRWLWRQRWFHVPQVAFKWLLFALEVLLVLVPFSFCFFLVHGKGDEAQKRYHRMLQKVALHPVHILGWFRVRVHNDFQEDFQRPAMVICNHQSMVDIPAVLSLTPNLIIISKSSYARHPVLAPILHFAGFYTVADGYEQLLEKLRDKVAAGWSVMVFPEGTRTRDGQIHRFHRGAFFLAEELGLDIVPCWMENSYDLWRKGCYFPKGGTAHLQVLQRVKPDDSAYGEGFRHRAKGFERYYKQLTIDN